MEIPELVADHIGDEKLRRGVMLGDEDALCLTPSRTLLYRSDGLLSDESVAEYSHTVERLQISEGRRKTKFVLDYVEGTESFTVPNDVKRDVLGLVLEGVLLSENLIDDEESVAGAFRFSELTLIVAEKRVLKHVGNAVWEEDFETFAFEDLTGLEFEKASVATEVVLRIGGRPERIKTPNDQARLVEQTVKKAVFEFFDVTSMDELDEHFRAEAAAAEEESGGDDEPDADAASDDDIGLGEGGIDPLVEEGSSDSPFADPFSEGDDDPATASEDPAESADTAQPSAGGQSEARQPGEWPEEADERGSRRTDRSESTGQTGRRDRRQSATTPDADLVTQEDMDEVTHQLTELTEAVNRQNELLRDQQQAIKQLIKELRQGR
jgi:hypothetical protein